MKKRFAAALGAYVILSIIASFVLHGTALYAVLILFVYFAIRSLIAVKAGWQFHNETPPPETDSESNHE